MKIVKCGRRMEYEMLQSAGCILQCSLCFHKIVFLHVFLCKIPLKSIKLSEPNRRPPRSSVRRDIRRGVALVEATLRSEVRAQASHSAGRGNGWASDMLQLVGLGFWWEILRCSVGSKCHKPFLCQWPPHFKFAFDYCSYFDLFIWFQDTLTDINRNRAFFFAVFGPMNHETT